MAYLNDDHRLYILLKTFKMLIPRSLLKMCRLQFDLQTWYTKDPTQIYAMILIKAWVPVYILCQTNIHAADNPAANHTLRDLRMPTMHPPLILWDGYFYLNGILRQTKHVKSTQLLSLCDFQLYHYRHPKVILIHS